MDIAKSDTTNAFAYEKPSKWVMRVRAAQRVALWHFFSKRIPLYLVTEYPKSGGTWYAKMLSECLQVPFPDPQAPPRLKTMILRDTKLYSPHYHNVTVMMRDGRDIMVSAYYHFLFHNESNLPYGVEKRRRHLNFNDFDDIRSNLPRFIEYLFQEFPKSGWSTRFNWAQFVDSWWGKPVAIVRYEDLLNDTATTLGNVLLQLTGKEFALQRLTEVAEKFSFAKMTGRKPGEEKKNTFARKGIAGDWRNHFSQSAKETFLHFGGKQLIKLGYEVDNHWAAGE
jgi:Sulfotransferase domain